MHKCDNSCQKVSVHLVLYQNGSNYRQNAFITNW